MIACLVAQLGDSLRRELVADFLKRFKALVEGHGLIIARRDSYLRTLAYLGITVAQAKQIIMELQPSDYYKGTPYSEDPDSEEVCEFGTRVQDEEVYIKLLIDKKRGKAICLSFHIPRREIEHPLSDSESKEGT